MSMRLRWGALLALVLAAGAASSFAQAPVDGSDAGAPEAAAPAAGAADPIDARITQANGDVYVHYASDPDGQFAQAAAGTPLQEGDLVRTGQGATAEVSLDGTSVIDVNENSDFVVRSLDRGNASFELGIGSFVAKLKKLLQGQNLSFATPTAVAAVRGTELGISFETDDQPAHVGVFDEGHVVVQAQGGATVALDPGQETEVGVGAAPSAPGPLRVLAVWRPRLAAVRARQAVLFRTWRPWSPAQRMAFRRRFLARPRLAAGQLRGVRADRMNRVYRGFQRRQAVQGRLRQAAQRRQGRAAMQARRAQRQRMQQQRRQRMQQRRRSMQQRRQPQRRRPNAPRKKAGARARER